MKTHELFEVPQMVQKYPDVVEKSAISELESVTRNPDNLRTEYKDGNTRIASGHKGLYLFVGGKAIGLMNLTRGNERAEDLIGKTTWQVMNVYVLPEHRNKRYGLMLYRHILHRRKEAFSAGAAMTPSSRRVWDSLFRDSRVDVYGLAFDHDQPEKLELHIGPEGITTGAPAIDKYTIFIATEK